MDRRRFLVQASGSAVSASLLSGCASVAWTPVAAPDGLITVDLDAHPELARAGGSLILLPEGHSDPLYLLESEGEYVALSPICTHRGCTVGVEGLRLVCPCHGSTYDRNGTVVRGPAARPLLRLPLERRENTLRVDVTGGVR